MSNAVMFITFKLAEGVAPADFLQISKKLNDEFMAKQKGYISWQQLVDGDTWADVLTWETMADAHHVHEASEACALAHEFGALLDPESIKMNMFTVERSYK